MQTVPSPSLERPFERSRLEAALHRAAGGHGQIVVLSGEAGVGKTRLVHEVLGSPTCAITPSRVRWSSHVDAHGSRYFSPWRALLGSPTDPLALSASGPPMQDDPSEPAPPAIRRLFDLCRSGPLALVIDDLQDADSESLVLLDALAATIAALPLCVITVLRTTDDGSDRRHHIDVLLRKREVIRIELASWNSAEIETYATSILGAPPQSDDLHVLELLTKGNPARVTDCLRGCLDPGPLARACGSTLPASLESELVRSMGALDPETRRLLELFAIFGESVPWSFAVRLADALPNEPAIGLSALDRVLGIRLIGSDERTGHLRFAHPVVRSAILRDVAPLRLARLHGRAGDLLADDTTQPYTAARIARHFAAAAILPEFAAKAVQASRLAGYRAELDSAHAEAADHYRNALDALRATPPDAIAAPSRRAELLIALGHSLAVESPLEAIDALQEAHSIAESLASRLGEWASRIQALAVIVRCERIPPSTPVECRTTLARAERVLVGLPSGDHVLRARLLSVLTPLLRFETDRSRAAQFALDALRAAEASGDPTARGRALEAHHWAMLDEPAGDERLAVASEILRAAEETGDPRLAADARTWRYLDLLEIGRIEAAEAELIAIEAASRDLGEPRRRYQALCLRSGMSLHRGRLEGARALAREAIALARRFDVSDARHPCLATLARVAIELNESLTSDDLDWLRVGSASTPVVASSWPFIHERIGYTAAAEQELSEIKRIGFDSIARGPDWLATLHNLAWSAVSLADRDACSALYAELEPRAQSFVVYALGSVTSSIARLLGNLARVLERLDVAESWLDQALLQTAGSHARCDLAHAHVERAAVRIDRGVPLEDERVQADLRSALDHALELGLIHAAARVAALDPRLSGDAELARMPIPGTFRLRRGRWLIRLGDRHCELRDQRGLQLIAALLARSGEEISAVDLVRIVTGDIEDSIERARARVAVRVHTALDRLGSAHSEVALHLRQYLRTGKYCSYLPPSQARIDWDLGDWSRPGETPWPHGPSRPDSTCSAASCATAST